MSLFRVSSPSQSVGRGRGEEEGKERANGRKIFSERGRDIGAVRVRSFAVRRMNIQQPESFFPRNFVSVLSERGAWQTKGDKNERTNERTTLSL